MGANRSWIIVSVTSVSYVRLASSIRCTSERLRVIDDDDLDRCPEWLQLQAELFVQG